VALGLRDRWRVLAPDLRGHGGSEWSNDYSQQAWVDDVELFAETLGVRRFTLAGHLMGARIAWLYAARHPERVERLVVVGLAPMKPRRFPPAARDSFGSVGEAAAAAREARYERTPDAVYRRFLERFLTRGSDNRWTWRHDPRLRAAPEEQSGFAADIDEQWRGLRAVRCPTLILHAEDSEPGAREKKEEMVRAMRDARLVEISGVRDLLLDDAPQTIAALRAFLDGR
jgi:pimeloyl-ACP methyl ester carboxylesterase